MNFEWFIARRYLWSRRRHPFVGIMSTISVLGIAVGVAALITVLAVMSGFDEDLKDRIIGARAHLVVERTDAFVDWPEALRRVESLGIVRGAAPFVEGQALLQKDRAVTGILVRGIDPARERRVSKFNDYLMTGSLGDAPGGAVLGSELAKRLGARPGSEVLLLTQGAVKPSRFRVDGTFSSGMYEYDANLLFLNLPDAQALFGFGPSVSGLSVFLKDAGRAAEAKTAVQRALGYPHVTRTWMDTNRALFSALKLEKTVMFLILALIVLVACLNIAGGLTVLVMNKTREIGLLKALGATRPGLLRIFALDGLAIGVTGAGAGSAIGVLLCAVLERYSFIELPKDIYYFDRLPVNLRLPDALAVVIVAVFLSFLSALYPASVAARLDPAKALRYE